jgi:hypothetical protein
LSITQQDTTCGTPTCCSFLRLKKRLIHFAYKIRWRLEFHRFFKITKNTPSPRNILIMQDVCSYKQFDFDRWIIDLGLSEHRTRSGFSAMTIMHPHFFKLRSVHPFIYICVSLYAVQVLHWLYAKKYAVQQVKCEKYFSIYVRHYFPQH